MSLATLGRVQALFATPLILHAVENACELNANLEREILAKRRADGGVTLSNRGGWQSKHDYAKWCGEDGRAVIKRALALATAHTQSAHSASPRWAVDAWANVNETGAFNMPHIHGATYWAAVYYVRVGTGEGGSLVLHDPRMPALRMHAPSLSFRDMGPELRAEVQPTEGMTVLFPGWLSHSVEPWRGSGHRISLAMNIRAL